MSRVPRTLMTILAILGLALSLPAATVTAADCSFSVSPRSGVPGTAFVFKGTGFVPTEFILTRGRGAPDVVDVSYLTESPFRVELLADDTQVGRWRVMAEGCDVATSFRVSLPSTATAESTSERPDDATQLAGLILLGVLFLSAVAVLLPRLTRAARSR